MTNPAAIEETGFITIEIEDVFPFKEERPPLLIECFKGREVHNGRVGFDLSEIRVDGKIGSEITGQTDFGIQPGAAKPGSSFVCKRIPGFACECSQSPHRVWHEFNTA